MRVMYLGKNAINLTYKQYYDVTDVVDSYVRIRDDFSEEYLYKIDNGYWNIEGNMDASEYFEVVWQYNIVRKKSIDEVAVASESRNIHVKKDIEVAKKIKYGYDFDVEDDVNIEEIDVFIEKGTKITGVKIIASGTEIREVERLISQYLINKDIKTKPSDWKKMRGTAIITDGDRYRKKAEVHWYQSKNVGKVEFKVTNILGGA